MPRNLLALGLSLSLGLSVPAFAGIVDSPLPELEPGKTTVHVYSVPGIIELLGLSTFYSCTNTDSGNIRIGIEAFGPAGGAAINNAAMTSVAVLPGGTVTFGGNSAVGIAVNSDLNLPMTARGSARILATSKKLICTAYTADTGNSPPASAWQLTIIAKTKQKAAN
jgi:hypothetical protein